MRARPQRQQNAQMVTLPAPIGGWNARDAYAAMPALDAFELVNWFPRPDRVVSRGGHEVYASGLGGQVETLIEWRGPTSRKFKAIANNKIWDITAPPGNTIIPAAEVTGLASSRFIWTTLSSGVATYVVMTDGVSGVREYDGTTWTTPTITGVSPTLLTYVNNYRGRLFFIEGGTLNAWYLGRAAIQGAASKLDFTRDAKRGGYLMAMGTWLQDSGEGGIDDLAVFVTSEGEVIVYQGSDPSSATSWSQVGIFQVGKPIGLRCLMRFGSDLCLLLQDGFFPVSTLLQSSVQSPALALSDKIRNAFVGAALTNQTRWGWEAIYHPNGQRVIVNVPTGSGYDQYVMNAITKAWCRFAGIDGTIFGLFNSDLYCGKLDGKVYRLDNGVTTDIGNPIALSGQQAFNDLGNGACEKFVTAVRFKLGTNGQATINFAVNYDYEIRVLDTGGTVLTGGGGILWSTDPTGVTGQTGAGKWDVSPWGSAEVVTQAWFTYGGVGRVVSPHLSIQSRSFTSWYDTDILAEAGGLL